jgi:hypothetical protein
LQKAERSKLLWRKKGNPCAGTGSHSSGNPVDWFLVARKVLLTVKLSQGLSVENNQFGWMLGFTPSTRVAAVGREAIVYSVTPSLCLAVAWFCMAGTAFVPSLSHIKPFAFLYLRLGRLLKQRPDPRPQGTLFLFGLGQRPANLTSGAPALLGGLALQVFAVLLCQLDVAVVEVHDVSPDCSLLGTTVPAGVVFKSRF